MGLLRFVARTMASVAGPPCICMERVSFRVWVEWLLRPVASVTAARSSSLVFLWGILCSCIFVEFFRTQLLYRFFSNFFNFYHLFCFLFVSFLLTERKNKTTRKQISAKNVGCLPRSALFNVVIARQSISASTHGGSLKNDSSTSFSVELCVHTHLSSRLPYLLLFFFFFLWGGSYL